MRTKLEAYQNELGAPFEQNLSKAERQQMQELANQVNTDRDALAKASETRSDVSPLMAKSLLVHADRSLVSSLPAEDTCCRSN